HSMIAWPPASAPPHPPTPLLLEQEALQRPGSRDVTQPRQRLFLDLADALARDAQQRADLFEGHRLLAFEAEIEPQDLRLAVLERRQHFLDGFSKGVLEDLVVGTGVLGVGQ